MTTHAMILENELNLREADYRDFCKKWILKKNEDFKEGIERRKRELANPREIRRHPGDWPHREPMNDFEMLEWYWSEALFCGDISYDAPEEFFGEDYSSWMDKYEPDSGDELMQRFDRIFNEVFCEVMPKELHHVLEG